MFGFLNLNKPIEMTSRNAVDCVKRILRPISRAVDRKLKLGHAGTLDPLATGVLVVAVGPATRLIGHVQSASKTYRATFQLGVDSDSLDLETSLREIEGAPIPDESEIQQTLSRFVGEQDQVPPAFSAAKVNGRRAYRLARQGKEFELSARRVRIDAIKLIRFNYPNLEVEIICGSGTYIRSLGRDIGKQLNSAAVMTSLTREAIGPFRIENALDPETLTIESIQNHLLSPVTALREFPSVDVGANQIEAIRNGVMLDLQADSETLELIAINSNGELVALLQKSSTGLWRPNLNFSGYDQSAWNVHELG